MEMLGMFRAWNASSGDPAFGVFAMLEPEWRLSLEVVIFVRRDESMVSSSV